MNITPAFPSLYLPPAKATLISAVITAFLVDFSKSLDTSTLGLGIRVVFILWFTSLTASLGDLLIAIFSKIYLARYESWLLESKFQWIEEFYSNTHGSLSSSDNLLSCGVPKDVTLIRRMEMDNRFMIGVSPNTLEFDFPFTYSFNYFYLLSIINIFAVVTFFSGVVVRFTDTTVQTAVVVIGSLFPLFVFAAVPLLQTWKRSGTLLPNGGIIDLQSTTTKLFYIV